MKLSLSLIRAPALPSVRVLIQIGAHGWQSRGTDKITKMNRDPDTPQRDQPASEKSNAEH